MARAMGGPALVAAVAASSLGIACAPPNLSRTLGAGNYEVRGSLGGPFVTNLGPPIPVPHAHVGARVGVTDWMDVDGNFNLLAAAFSMWAMDVATNFQLYRRPKGLAVASSTRLFILGDLNDAPKARVFPELGLHLGGPAARWLNLSGGMTSAVQFRAPAGKPPVFVTPFVGTEFLFPARKERQHGLAIHFSWTNPWEDATSVVNYAAGRGAVGLQLGYRVRFGGLDR